MTFVMLYWHTVESRVQQNSTSVQTVFPFSSCTTVTGNFLPQYNNKTHNAVISIIQMEIQNVIIQQYRCKFAPTDHRHVNIK
jgi:hypothetical protein